MSTRYHTKCTADTLISLPNIPVNPQMKTVKCRMTRFLLSVEGAVSEGIIWVLLITECSLIYQTIH